MIFDEPPTPEQIAERRALHAAALVKLRRIILGEHRTRVAVRSLTGRPRCSCGGLIPCEKRAWQLAATYPKEAVA